MHRYRPALREFLTALRQLTETGTADFHGELLTATAPVPARVPGAESGVPLLVAAMGPPGSAGATSDTAFAQQNGTAGDVGVGQSLSGGGR